MTDYVALALKYGGFTSLDKIYLSEQLASLSDEQKMSFITPPPSVINAYFAEIYQKQSPSEATDYYFDLSKNLKLWTTTPSFTEETKPFIRLNLSGKSYGFVYESDQEIAHVFSEEESDVSADLLFELAQIFPHYKVYEENNLVKMAKIPFEEETIEVIPTEKDCLSQIVRLKGNVVKLSSFNQEEILALAANYTGQRYYSFSQRQLIIYIKE